MSKKCLKISKEDQKEDIEKRDFPHTYNEVIEGERKLDKSKPSKWMDMETEFKEVNISNDG